MFCTTYYQENANPNHKAIATVPVRMATMNKNKITTVAEVVKKRAPSCTAKNVN